jgi:hypothetical protein
MAEQPAAGSSAPVSEGRKQQVAECVHHFELVDELLGRTDLPDRVAGGPSELHQLAGKGRPRTRRPRSPRPRHRGWDRRRAGPGRRAPDDGVPRPAGAPAGALDVREPALADPPEQGSRRRSRASSLRRRPPSRARSGSHTSVSRVRWRSATRFSCSSARRMAWSPCSSRATRVGASRSASRTRRRTSCRRRSPPPTACSRTTCSS